MEAISHAINYMSTFQWQDGLDVLIVAFIIYKAIMFVRSTNSHSIAKGLLLLLVLTWISGAFKLTMLNFVLRKGIELGLIAVLILFQPELRRLLDKVGTTFSSGSLGDDSVMESAIKQTVRACTEMSSARTGALIIFERYTKLNSIMATGTIINSDASSELIKNIFFNKAPLHDGALILREGRLAAAGCVLPLTQNNNLSKDLGMRHRAGIGLSEQSDAVVIIVSEETGAISVAMAGSLKRHLTGGSLESILRTELIRENMAQGKGLVTYFKRFFTSNKSEENGSNE